MTILQCTCTCTGIATCHALLCTSVHNQLPVVKDAHLTIIIRVRSSQVPAKDMVTLYQLSCKVARVIVVIHYNYYILLFSELTYMNIYPCYKYNLMFLTCTESSQKWSSRDVRQRKTDLHAVSVIIKPYKPEPRDEISRNQQSAVWYQGEYIV